MLAAGALNHEVLAILIETLSAHILPGPWAHPFSGLPRRRETPSARFPLYRPDTGPGREDGGDGAESLLKSILEPFPARIRPCLGGQSPLERRSAKGGPRNRP